MGRKTDQTIRTIDDAINKRFSEWPKYITLFLTVLTLAVGMAIWATDAHSDIKTWTAEQDFVTKQELKDVMKEQYVPVKEFVKVQTSLDLHVQQHRQLQESMNKLEKKLDRLERRSR